jgi:DNA-binding transcriptional MerR regulator
VKEAMTPSDPVPPQVPDEEFTIDELARAADTTVRSVRVYHERGILPPPELRGRTGYYRTAHLTRLRTVARLLERGMKLAGIKELFDTWDRGEGLAEVLGFIDEVATRYHQDPDKTIAVNDLKDWYADSPEGLDRAVALGVFEPTEDPETYRVLSRQLPRFGGRLIAAGVPLERVLDELEALKADCDRIAARHGALFHELIWEPYQRSEHSPEALAKVADYLAATRRMSGDAAAELIAQALQRSLETNTPELLDAVRALDKDRL